jgi:hypothetical protein
MSAVDNTGKWALLKTNGTAAGIRKVLNINQIVEMVEAQGKLYLFVADGSDATKLSIYVTNGTEQSTHFLFQIPAPRYSYAAVLNAFYVRPAVAGNEVWRTDGTACGTFSFDLGIDAGYEIAENGATLLFPGRHPDKGVEPYYYDTTPLAASCDEETSIASAATAEIIPNNEALTRAYPNPFQHELVLEVAGVHEAEAHVQVFSISGSRIDNLGTLKCNTEYSIGSEWPLGMYVLQIKTGGKISSQKVIKQR